MRYREFKLTEQQLEELKMSPRSLGAFAKSPVAKGIQAGFEAEMIFPGLGGVGDDDDGDMEPDYDADERCEDIDDIIRFFENDEYGQEMSSRQARDLRNSLDEAYWEARDEAMMAAFNKDALELVRDYIYNNDWDQAEQIREYLSTEGVKNIDDIMARAASATSTRDMPPEYQEASAAVDAALEEKAQESLNSQDGNWDEALEEFRNDYDDYDESEWLSDRGFYTMSDIQDEYGLDWPIMMRSSDAGPSGGFDEDNAQEIAGDMANTLGVNTKVSSGYHSATRDATTWIFEPDTSLEANDGEDMPVEIISPPMELEECLKKLDQFFSWADTHNAYTNSSTGFHMGVSLPNVGGKVDFVKLALFLGDEYVLESFGRSAVGYCESAMKKIRNRIKRGDSNIGEAMAYMRNGLGDIAHNSIASDDGFGKYTSINPKGNYIEFRSAGNVDYSKDIPKLKSTLLRYAQAMVVAADPQLERKEYYKKFYKLISPAGGSTAMDLFARYTSGVITSEQLKQQWASATLEKEKPSGESGKWEVFDEKTGEILFTVDAQSRGEAIEKGFESGDINWRNSPDARPVPAEPKPSRRLDLAKRIKGPTPPNFYIKNADTDEIVHLYNAANREQAHEMLKQYSSTHQGRFLFGETKYLKPDELAQARKNAAADTATQQPAATQPQQQQPQQQQAHADNGLPMWEIYQRSNNLPLHRFADHTQMTAWSAAGEWARNNGFHPQDLSLRPATTSDPVMPQV